MNAKGRRGSGRRWDKVCIVGNICWRAVRRGPRREVRVVGLGCLRWDGGDVDVGFGASSVRKVTGVLVFCISIGLSDV